MRWHEGNKHEMYHFPLVISFLHVSGSCLAHIRERKQVSLTRVPHTRACAHIQTFSLRAPHTRKQTCDVIRCDFESQIDVNYDGAHKI